MKVRIFNILAMAGCISSFLTGTVSLFTGADFILITIVYIASILSAVLVIYSSRTQKYQRCYVITIIVIFLGFFSYLFFTSGGYHGGMPLYFVFAVVFTIFMLEGKKALLTAFLEIIFYAGLFFCAYLFPDIVVEYTSETDRFINHIGDLFIVSCGLGATMYAQVKLYRAQQRKVDVQNIVLEQVNHSKTQFLANTSHEMRTPLTVVSVDIQTVMGILKRMDSMNTDEEVQGLLQDAQDEIMRLSRMVAGMLSLNALAEHVEKSKFNFASLSKNTAEMMRLILRKQGNELATDIMDDLIVYGSADLLSQVLINLLQNANTHTKNGIISLSISEKSSIITTSVSDTGSGISPEMLPHVFERGVTDGGTGVGLFLCKTVVESHGGTIQIESEVGKGTTVTFNLPVYQGQLG